jgi:hypothetical protein
MTLGHRACCLPRAVGAYCSELNLKGDCEMQRLLIEPPVGGVLVGSLLDAARFWTRILKEHALFIRLGLPADQVELRAEAQAFFDLFEELEARVNEVQSIDPGLLQDLIEAVNGIIAFKRRLLGLQVECKIAPCLYPLLVDHITREAVNFLNLLKDGAPEDPLDAILAIEVFWLRQMKEHIEFVRGLLDPSERLLIVETDAFSATFSRLLEEARDLASMNFQAQPDSFNTVTRFTDTALENLTRLRDFKAAAHELALLCQLLSIVSTPLLLDHIRREADRALVEIGALRELLDGGEE